jgi:probable HAF family extracellular repeat protein
MFISAGVAISVVSFAAPAVAVTSTPLNFVLKTIFIGSAHDPNPGFTDIRGVNDSVEVVGNGALGPFTERGDTLERFTLPQCPNCLPSPVQINASGDVVGTVQLTPSQFAAFVHSGTHNRLIKGPLGTKTLFPGGFNASGEVTGSFVDAGGNYHLFLDQNGTFTSFSVPFPGVTYQFASAINDAGQIVGNYIDATGPHSFLYSGGKFTSINVPFAGASNPSVTAINAHGEIIGVYYDAQGSDHSFLYVNGRFSTLSADDFGEMFFTAINDHGDVAGTPWADRSRIVLYTTDGHFGTAEIQGSSLVSIGATVTGLNNNGQIVGTYRYAGGRLCGDACPTVGFLLNRIEH